MSRLRTGFTVVRVMGDSMRPAYADGDRLLGRRSRRYQVGDVIVFRVADSLRLPGGGTTLGPEFLIKRIAAVAGDPVPEDLRVHVTGLIVGPGAVLVRGDNPASLDSRRMGPVPVESIVAKVVCRLDHTPPHHRPA